MYWERQTAKPQQDIARWEHTWHGCVSLIAFLVPIAIKD